MAKKSNHRAKSKITVTSKTIIMPDGNLRIIPVRTLDDIEATLTWYFDPQETLPRVQLIAPLDYPSGRLSKVFNRLRKEFKKVPVDPRQANQEIAIHRRAIGLVKSGHISRKVFEAKIKEPGYCDPAIVSPTELQKQRKSRLVAVKASKPRKRPPSVSKQVWKSVHDKWVNLKGAYPSKENRLLIIETWYEAKREILGGPAMKKSRLLRYAQFARYPH